MEVKHHFSSLIEPGLSLLHVGMRNSAESLTFSVFQSELFRDLLVKGTKGCLGEELTDIVPSYSSHRLINQEGSLLSYAGSEDRDAKVTAAIASSIWAAYEKNGKMAFHNDELKVIFMDCEVCIC